MSASPDAFKIQMELSEVIRLHNQTLEALRAFRDERPYAVAPNILKMVEENLKENVAILYKQWNEVHKPPTERVRHVCTQCSYVFASALPGGICDECRSKGVTTQPAAYGAWPITPESEDVTQFDATPLPDEFEVERALATTDPTAQSANIAKDNLDEDSVAENELPLEAEQPSAAESDPVANNSEKSAEEQGNAPEPVDDEDSKSNNPEPNDRT